MESNAKFSKKHSQISVILVDSDQKTDTLSMHKRKQGLNDDSFDNFWGDVGRYQDLIVVVVNWINM